MTIREASGSTQHVLVDRRVELERRLQGEVSMSEERKQRHLQQLGKKESTFLRLRRTKLGLDDFRTVKVIGKGAFGEVKAQASWICSRAGQYSHETAEGSISPED